MTNKASMSRTAGGKGIGAKTMHDELIVLESNGAR